LEFVKLVGDARRWQILRELSRSDRRVHELTDRLGEPQNLVSYHLGLLRGAGLVSARRSAADGRDMYYRIEFSRCAELWREAGGGLLPGLRLEASPSRFVASGHRPRVLFLCTGNSARSQMAEAFLRHRTGGQVDARSAGSRPKPLHPNAVRVMAEHGIDISACQSKHARRFARSHFDHIVTLCDRVREVCPELMGHPETAHWSVADPALDGGDDNATYASFVRTADEIAARVSVFVAQLDHDNAEVSDHG
jgi:protein-tyrosine-phosphatase/DNA-binding transcriptional ArsR family regulator